MIILYNLVKAQAQLSDYGEIYLNLFSFVRRQSEFAFFGAMTSVVALFIFIYGGFMLEVIKLKIKQFLKITSAAVTITCPEDYAKARSWLKKATIICGICSVLGIAYGLMIGILSLSSDVIPFGVLSIPIGFILGQWSFWGVATFILNIREILNIKKIVELGKIGYTAGKEIKETHINVTHEFGNQYKVTSHTEHKGCLFAFAAIFIRFLFWMYFSVIVGAFLTVKKLIQTVHNIKEYQKNEV